MTFHSKRTISIHVEVVSLLVVKTMPHGYPCFVKILHCRDCSDTFVQMLQNIPVQCVSVSSTQVDDNDSQEYYPHQITWNVVKWDVFTFASLLAQMDSMACVQSPPQVSTFLLGCSASQC
jgi:hypothetical protein